MAPEGITFHSARLRTRGAADLETLRRMAKRTLDAALDLAEARVSLVVYCCTASSFVEGRQHDVDMIESIRKETGLPCVTTMQSIEQALQALGIRTPILISPYSNQLEHLEVEYLKNSGFDVAASTAMGISDLLALHDPIPGDIYQLALRTFAEEADGILISCNALRAHMIADVLERDLNRPVVTSLTATLWGILNALNIAEPVDGFGRLLRDRNRDSLTKNAQRRC
jgi:maleate isomerase